MGCDIHLYVEKRKRNAGGWVSADKWTPSPYEFDKGLLRVDYDDRFYSGRNYDLFAILANVRNGIGFAGLTTGMGFVPIAEPRGLPKDVCASVKAESDLWGIDGHSHSWFTVAELLEYDWTQVTMVYAWVNALEYWKWSRWRKDHGEMPEEYSGGVSGHSVIHCTEGEMQEWLASLRIDEARHAEKIIGEAKGFNRYCQIAVRQPYHRCCASFWSECIPRLLALGKPAEVRIVFWFDN